MSSQHDTDVNDEATAKSTATEAVQRIQILAGATGDTQALEELLAPHYDVRMSETLQDVDCYIVDDQSLPPYHDTLVEMKTEAHPTFCPVLLMHREDTHVQVRLPNEPETDHVRPVDDVIDAPVTQEALVRRIENLLARRAQSLELTREYDRAEQWFQSLFGALPDPAFVLDTDGRIRAPNDAFCALVGESRPALVGEQIASVPTYGSAFEDLQAAVETGQSDSIEKTNNLIDMTPEREARSEFSHLSVQTAAVNENRYVVGILSDVTELKRKTDRLEELASVLSHDLRNPIQVAELNIQALEATLTTEHEEINAIERSVDRIKDLTEKLVSVARTGEDALDRKAIKPHSCVRGAWNSIATGSAELIIESEAMPQCRADQVRFEQLLENLFKNAIDHGSEDATVWFGWESNSFYIEDDGPGIPEHKREKIFEMGYSNHPGGGLGLAIVSEIAEAHGWQIQVADGREGGAQFYFSGVESVYE